MANKLLHTPDGVRDIYDVEYAQKRSIEQRIQTIYHLYGYRGIETPTFEFFEIFSKEKGSAGSRELFKFFDQDNNTLVLRPDMTPPIARCVTKYYPDEDMPVRLCYLEPTFINSTSYQGRLKERTQTGAELIGDDSSDADAELIAMVIDSLKAAGLEQFQVELGQVDFFRGLLDEAGMNEDTQEELHGLIENKNYFGVEELVSKQHISADLKQIFFRLPELFGSIEQIKLARTLTGNERAIRAIDRLERVQEILDLYGLGDYVSYDLGMLSKYSYYTGIIFKAYTYGTGDYVVTGGRYDKLLVQFGKDMPAVGFAIEVDRLMMALSRQKIEIPTNMVSTMILCEKTAREKAIRLSGFFRAHNTAVQMMRRDRKKSLDDYLEYASRTGILSILYLDGEGDQIRAFDVLNGQEKELALAYYIRE